MSDHLPPPTHPPSYFIVQSDKKKMISIPREIHKLVIHQEKPATTELCHPAMAPIHTQVQTCCTDTSESVRYCILDFYPILLKL